MNKLKKILIVGIIILFAGVICSSAISVDIKSIRLDNNGEEYRGCNKVIDADLVNVESLLDKFEVYSKLFMVLSSFNTELADINEELSNDITILFEIYEEIKSNSPVKDFPIICSILEKMLLQINDTCWNIVELILKYESTYPTLTITLALMLWILAMTIEPLIYLSVFLGCYF